MGKNSISDFIKENKTVLIIIIVGLFLIEMEIFALAVMKSGRKSWLEVIDANGNVIHETDGKNLSDFNKYYFEKTFGPFENYEVRLKSQDKPFPFRAWFVAAIGLPIGAMLLFGFIVKAWVTLFKGGSTGESAVDAENKTIHETRMEMVLDKVSRMNIFIIGFLIFIGVISYWIIPNMITYIGKTGIDTIVRFKWFFLSAIVVVMSIGMWIVYLRYLLAKKTIESRTEIEKHRLQIELGSDIQAPLQIENKNTMDSSAGEYRTDN